MSGRPVSQTSLRKRSGSVLITLAVALLTTCSVQANDAPSAESQTVLFFAPDRPVVIRLHLEVGGRAFGDVWRSMARDVFDLADRDEDGWLSPEELKTPAESNSGLRSELLEVLGAPGILQADVDPVDGRLSPLEFTSFLEAQKGGAFQAPALAGNPSSNRADGMLAGPVSSTTEMLLKILDRDGNGKIALEELRDGSQSLKSRDFDGDGACSIDELDHTRSPFVQTRVEAGAESAVPVAALSDSIVDRDILQQVLVRYGQTGPEGLEGVSLERLGIPENLQAHYDEDGNGLVDRQELREYLIHPTAHVELQVRIGGRPPATPPVSVLSTASLPNITVRTSDIGLVCIALGEIQLEISAAPQPRTADGLKSTLQRRFQQADGDANGYLDLQEAERLPVLGNSFSLFDRDADGKVFEEEFLTVLEGRIQLGVSRVRMTPINRGRNLLEILDTNRDRRLTVREFAGAMNRFDLWDANSDQQLAVEEVPQIYQLVLDRGVPDLPGFESVMENTVRPRAATAARSENSGPTWFLKMDQNGDGDVSRNEFLGRISQFEELDRDGNGLLDSVEAGAAARP